MRDLQRKTAFIAVFLQTVLNFTLTILAMILVVFLLKKTVFIFDVLLIQNEEVGYFYLAEGIIVYFLYFEFISLIIKYFTHNYHFPLRYFIYIGITAIIRLIIIDHEHPHTILLYALAIVLLVFALLIANHSNMKDDDQLD
ncbi:phosphate-starvation-inducible protein PsiE [Terribacillus sp. 179-K 1B1 HS]|uniref:Protein PsiE n=1 Tax=Terribacillus halophilus TaxID=361279 RepID=A0A1G6P9H8_9BACI|nr:phosphate-starvation-inducible protein PsiE [Terribacillus halophilus]SDC76264.1 protein PsiE [Terribacillus halophilus]